MGLKYYDEAVHSIISSWVNNSNMKILRPQETSELFNINADINMDKPLTLPLIALSRNTEIEILDTKKTLFSFDGKHLGSSENKTLQLNAIPIRLGYQIDIYTKDFNEAYAYVRELVFAFINNPKIIITLPYNGVNKDIRSYIRLQSTITDNSDIPERLFRDQFTRITMQLEIEDAYLFSLPFNQNGQIIGAELQLVKPNSNIIEDKEKIYLN